MTTRGTDTNVERCDSLILCNLCSCSCSLHGRVRSPLQPISFHMLTPGTSRNRLGTCKISDVNHGIVEARIDVRDTPAINRLFSLLCHETSFPEKPSPSCS